MEYKEFKPIIIATVVMIAMLGALCIATPAMAEEHVTVYIDVDGMTPRNPVIGVGESVCWMNYQESPEKDFVLKSDDDEWREITLGYKLGFCHPFDEPGYYEYTCSYTYMNGTVSMRCTMCGTVEVVPSPEHQQPLFLLLRPEISYMAPGDLRGLSIAKCCPSHPAYRKFRDFLVCNNIDVEDVNIEYESGLSATDIMCAPPGSNYGCVGGFDGCFVARGFAETIEQKGCGRIIMSSEDFTCPQIAGCDDLDQDVLKRYDFDNNGLIDSNEMEKAKIGYDSNYETQDDYEQILYAYEHQCLVGSTVSPTPTATVQPTPTATPAVTATPIQTEPQFRVGPTVVLRPVDDVIDKSQNGIVELYMNNPSLNDVTLTADIQISVPSGIHISGDGFGYGGAAGVVAGTFTVPPGTVRTININIRGEKTGVFTIHFTGLYWADGDKDAFQQVSLTHRLTVTDPDVNKHEPSIIETNTPSPGTGPINNTESNSIPTTYIVIGMGMLVVLLIIIIAARK